MSQSSSEWLNEWLAEQMGSPVEFLNTMQSPASFIDLDFWHDSDSQPAITAENVELEGECC